MIGKTNGSSGGMSNADFSKGIASVYTPRGTSSIYATLGGNRRNGKRVGSDSSKETWRIDGLDNGTWTFYSVSSSGTLSQNKSVSGFNMYYVDFCRTIPDFVTDCNYQVLTDNDSVISPSQFASYRGNWKIKFLTTGAVTFKNFYTSGGLVDIYLVGGGGGGGAQRGNYSPRGGGGGRTVTKTKVKLSAGTGYPIQIGGQSATTTGFGYSAEGGGTPGTAVQTNPGGNGGNGGAGAEGRPGKGGTEYQQPSGSAPGKSLDTRTREFNIPTGKFYATGGNWNGATSNRSPNTGDGGWGNNNGYGNWSGTGGGSGVVIIRNAR